MKIEFNHLKKYLKVFLVLFTINQSYGQNLYMSLEVGPKFEVYQSTDKGGVIYTKPFLYMPIYGLVLGHEINNVFSIESGLYINDYGESYRVLGDWGYGISNGFVAYQIPLRLKSQINLHKERLKLSTHIGYHFAIHDAYYSTSRGGGHFTYPQEGFTRTEDITVYDFRKTYSLIETGIGLDYLLKNSIILYLKANTLRGFSRVVETNVKYWVDEGDEKNATVFSNGDYFSFVFGIKYPIKK